MKKLMVRIEGVAPLLLHNGQLADPLNPYAKAIKLISGKRKKTDEDYAELAKLEWYGGLYLDKNRLVVMPTINIEECIFNGASKDKLKSAFKPAMTIEGFTVPIIYPGDKDIDKLYLDPNYKDCRGCVIGRSRVMRTRPVFCEWAIEFVIIYDEKLIQSDQIRQATEKAGRLCGLGDYLPRFGRFEVVKFNSI